VVVLVGLVGGYLTYTTHVNPGTTTESRELSAWESSGDFTHRATVVEGTTAFEEGTVLRNRTNYFRSISPRLNGTFGYGYSATDGGDLRAETTVVLVVQSVDGGTDGGQTVYWEYERVLGRTNASLAPGERTTVPFSVNVSAVDAEARQVDESVGGTPGEIQTAIVARTSLSGTRNGQSVETTRTYRLPLALGSNVYRVTDPGVVTNGDSRTEQVPVTVEYGQPRTIGGPLLALLGVGAGVALAAGRRTGRLSVTDHERTWLAYRKSREEFEDWITTARVPVIDRQPTVVEVETLGGLVDVAIDTDNRVIEDTERGVFLVLTGDRWYRYDPPTEPVLGQREQLATGDSANHARFERTDDGEEA
jgi:hypothetical protein